MSYAAIHGMKKETKKESTTSFVANLVIGNDVFALAKFLELEKDHSPEDLAIIADREIIYRDLFNKGPSTLRGEENIKVLKELYPEVEVKSDYGKTLFLKEGELKEYGGRAKGEKLLWGEKFYTQDRADIDLKNVFPFLNDQSDVTRVNEKLQKKIITGVKKAEATDLIDRANYAVMLSTGEEIQCENLYWTLGPAKFLDLYSNKNELSDNFISYCETLKTPCTLYLEYEFDEPVCDYKNTLLIPLSYTHEWGHFIGEFSNVDGSSSKQRASFLCFIDSDHNNEEDISRKIRLFKRNIEKICPNFKKNMTEEFITLNKGSFCSNFDETLYASVKNEMQNLSIVGLNGALGESETHGTSVGDSFFASTHLSRALISLR